MSVFLLNTFDIALFLSNLLGGIEVTSKDASWAVVAFAALLSGLLYTSVRPKSPCVTIHAIGRTGFITSYLDAIRFLRDANLMLQEGYAKYKPGIFRVPEMNRWHIVVCGDKYVEEIRKAPDDVLSLDEATKDTLAVDYAIEPAVTSDMYHINVVRFQLNRNLAGLFPEMRDELVHSFEDGIPVTDDWTPIKALEAVMRIVSQTSNRIFVGAPTCRDPEFIKLNIQFTIDVIMSAMIVNLFPRILKPLVGRMLTRVPKAIKIGLKHLGPIIEDRQQKINEYGFDYPDKPNDMLSWLMDEAKGDQRSARNITLRILAMNLAAIHTSSMSFTHALFHLASRPEYIPSIRDEVEAVVSKYGWNKVAMTHMRKLDSFLKESQRIDGLGGFTMSRKVMKDFTFSDGARLPKGAFVSVALATHFDEDKYLDAMSFNGFRFSDIQEEFGEETKTQMVTTSLDYLPFGHGKHACPGRFFAANELKAMMAHLILTYDIKLAKGEVRPANLWYAFACVPDPKAEVLFRKRRR